MSDTSFLDDVDQGIDDILAELGSKVKSLLDKRQEIAFMEDKLKEAKKEEATLSGEEIPQLLLSRGISEIKLDTGEKVEVVEKLAASMPKDPKKRQAIFTWLAENRGSHLIKQELKVEEPEAHIIAYLRGKGIPFDNEMSVNTNSFKAFLSAELGMKKGSLQSIELADIPREANPYVFKRTNIK